MQETNKESARQEAVRARQEGRYEVLEGREMESRREEYVKHFDLGAGRRQAVVFAEPVHYRAATGALADMDR